jgi:hypothetical protein
MLTICIPFGFVLAVFGVILYRRRRRMAGGLLILIGSSIVVFGVVVGAIAILNFHP